MHSAFRVALAGILALSPLAPSLHAQCPDGTPPPCNRPRPAPAPVRVTVPMDDRTWIVLPFENLARAADLDWLKDASVNLLYMDLSRWSDVRAVDDKRVADFVRDVPANRRLSLSDGLGIARRAGAGKLVMGEFLKVGSRTAVTATAYNARTGTSIRTVRRETAVLDSLMPLFGQLAGALLAVPPPSGSHVGAVGTSRADAYQEYIAGVSALNRFDAAEAKRRLTRALELDTGFALAHYKLAIASTYDEAAENARMAAGGLADPATLLAAQNDPARLTHAQTAARLGESLPARERALINGLLAHIKGDYAGACRWYGGLVRSDSSDVDALHGVGECSYKDDAVEFVGGDSTRPHFRSSWNETLRVLRRALAVDPTYHLAFDRILDVLSAPSRIGCRRESSDQPCGRTAARYTGTVRREADSLLIVPVRVTLSEAILAQVYDARRSSTRRRNLEEARAAAEGWVAAGPREGRAHRVLGRILLRLGRIDDAAREINEASALLPYDQFSELPMYQVEIAVKQGRGADVNRIFDSTFAAQKSEAVRLGASLLMGPIMGRVAAADSAAVASIRRSAQAAANQSLPPAIGAYFGQTVRIVLGIGEDSTAALEQTLLGLLRSRTTCSQTCLTLMAPSWIFGLRIKRPAWPGFDSLASRDRRLAPAIALSAGDTTRLRAAARMLDSVTAEDAKLGLPEDGATLVLTDAFLALGDSVSALRAVKRLIDSTLIFTPLEASISGVGIAFPAAIWPRAMLLRADLEAARGNRVEARKWYGRLAALWAKADAELMPIVERVKRGS